MSKQVLIRVTAMRARDSDEGQAATGESLTLGS